MMNERADIEEGGKKISGATYRIAANRAYHHGMVLMLTKAYKPRHSVVSHRLLSTQLQ